MITKQKYKYDIAISFAEEDRDIAIAVRTAFKLEKLKELHFYYYPDQPHEVAGYKSLNQRLHAIYNNESQYAIIILTKTYSKNDGYRQIELKAIKKRLATEEGRYLFVLAKAGTSPKDIGLADDFPVIWWDHNPEFLANIFLKIQNGEEIPEEIPKDKRWGISINKTIIFSILTLLLFVLYRVDFYADIGDWLIQDTTTSPDSGEVETDSITNRPFPSSNEDIKETTSGQEVEDEVKKDQEEYHYDQVTKDPLFDSSLFTDKNLRQSNQKDIAILILDDQYLTPQNLLASDISELLQAEDRKIYTGLLASEAVNDDGW
ncbi:MAG TPA: hypothetical protein DCG19_09820, partial [Cryomorphaceae bacterium]|nr:hypothetical protein [Cryomorphaceae bacterium]